MAINVSIGSNSYDVPVQGERSWGPEVTNLLVDLSVQADKIANNSFTLSGANLVVSDATGTYGVKANYFEGNLTVASVGGVRLANPADETPTVATAHTSVAWRNAGNTGNLLLKPNSDILLEFAGNVLVDLNTAQTVTNKTITSAVLDGTISGTSIKDEDDLVSDSDQHLATQQSIKAYVDSQVASKDTLEELTDTTITAPADANTLLYDTADSKWKNKALSGDITTDKAGVTAISSGVIVNDDVNASAAIDAAKLSTGSVSNTEFDTLDGVTSSIQTQLNTGATNLTDHESATIVHGLSGNVVGDTDTQTITSKTITRIANTLRRTVTTYSSAQTLSATVDDVVLVSGTTTITLPAPVSGQEFVIKKTDATLIVTTIQPDGAETIDGNANTTLTQINESITLVSDGTNWHII